MYEKVRLNFQLNLSVTPSGKLCFKLIFFSPKRILICVFMIVRQEFKSADYSKNIFWNPHFAPAAPIQERPLLARVRYLNSQGIQVVSESIFNVLFNQAPLSKSQKRRIIKQCSKDKNMLKEISKKRGSLKKKRKLLKQSGGYLGTLLGENYMWNNL